MTRERTDPPQRNHNLAILAITLALLGAFLADSPFVWLLLPAVLSGLLAYRSIRQAPERYTGSLFVFAAWGLSLVVAGLHLVFFLSQ